MAKVCKSCGEMYSGKYCDKCGYGDPKLKNSKAAVKYKKATKPERFRSEDDKAVYAKWEKERLEARKQRRNFDKNAGVKTLIITAVVFVAVVVVVLWRSGVIFKSDKRDVVKQYFASIQNSDFDKFIDCFPSDMKDEYEQQRKEGGYSKEDVMKKVLYSSFIEQYGEGYTISVKFGKETKLEKDDYDLEEYKKAYGRKPNISEAYELVVNVTFSGTKDTQEAKLYIYVGRVGPSWKIFGMTEDSGMLLDSRDEAETTE